MFTPSERAALRDALVAAAEADPRVVGAALAGSSAHGFTDEWSDIDLALSVADDHDAVVDDWTARIHREHGALTHLDMWAGATLFRVFLLPGTLQLDVAFWPEGADTHRPEIDGFFAGHRREPVEVLIASDDRGYVGFVELSIRNVVDGCHTGNVGYLEGWYVVPAARRRGAGRALVAAAEEWARGRGCTEFGSDVSIDNDASLAAHCALGFEKTSRVQQFRKPL